MGIWDGVCDSVNNCAIKPTKWVCWSVYSYSRAAVTGSDKVVRCMIQRMQHHDPEAAGSIAANCAKNAALFALREGAKTLPGGGPIYEIVTRSVKDSVGKKPPDDHTKKNGMMIEELNAQVNEYRERTAQLQSLMEDYREKTIQLQAAVSKLTEEEKKNVEAEAHVTGGGLLLQMNQEANLELKEQKQGDVIGTVVDVCGFLNKQQPEDTIRSFMMKGFMGAHVLYGLKPPGERE